MSCKFFCAAPRGPARHPERFPDMLKPSAPIRRNPPSPRATRPAPHAAENPANSCTPSQQESNSETAASILAPLPSAAPRPPADLPAARIHPKADTAPAAEYADCSKDSPPSGSQEQYSATPAETKTEWSPQDPTVSGRSRLRRIPSDTESNPHAAPEFLDPIFHWQIAPDRDRKARCQTRRRARQFSSPAQRPGFPAQPRAGIACDSQSFLHTSLPACARSEIRAPNIRGNA